MATRQAVRWFIELSERLRPSLLREATRLTDGQHDWARELVLAVLAELWDEFATLSRAVWTEIEERATVALFDRYRYEQSIRDRWARWLNMNDLKQLTGRSEVWLRRRLSQQGVPSEIRLNRANRLSEHWPVSVVPQLLKTAAEYPESGDWLPANSIAPLVGKDWTWVSARLDATRGELRRIPGSGKVFWHYPPEVVRELRALAKEIKAADGWMTIRQIAKYVGRSSHWVMNRLPTELMERRRARNGRPEPHYPPSVAAALLERRHEDNRGVNLRIPN